LRIDGKAQRGWSRSKGYKDGTSARRRHYSEQPREDRLVYDTLPPMFPQGRGLFSDDSNVVDSLEERDAALLQVFSMRRCQPSEKVALAFDSGQGFLQQA